MSSEEPEELTEEELAQIEADFQAALPAPGAPLLAARLTDPHVCPMVTGIVPHVGGPISGPGASNVLIAGLPAARATDQATCTGPPDMISKGSTTVLIGGLPAARLGDLTSHGGVIVMGATNVMIGG